MTRDGMLKRRRDQESNSGKKTSQMSVDELAKLAKERLSSVLEKKAYGASGLSQSADGWTVEVEVIEEEHVISSLDVIGIYEVSCDKDGNLTSWTRKGLRQRG